MPKQHQGFVLTVLTAVNCLYTSSIYMVKLKTIVQNDRPMSFLR